MDDTMPVPQSAYELRRHLETDHHLPLSGLAWTEMAAIHHGDHAADVGHTHEVGR